MGNWSLWVSALTRFRLERVVSLLDLDGHGFIGFLRMFVSTWLRGLLLLDGNKFLSIYLFIYLFSFGYYYRIFGAWLTFNMCQLPIEGIYWKTTAWEGYYLWISEHNEGKSPNMVRWSRYLTLPWHFYLWNYIYIILDPALHDRIQLLILI